MVTIKKIDDEIYEAEIQNSALIIDKHTGYHLKKEIGKILANKRKITVNMMQVDAMDKNGFQMLEQLVDLANKKNCSLSFINYGNPIASKFNLLYKSKEKAL